MFSIIRGLFHLPAMSAPRNQTRTAWIFYLLLTYVLLQLVWWGYNILETNLELYKAKTALAGQDFSNQMQSKLWMVAGEGAVFIVILVAAFIIIQRNIKREFALAEMEKTFLLSTSHELKTPVATIRLVLETLIKKNQPEGPSKTLLVNALQETGRLQDMTENILLASRIDHERGDVVFEKIDLARIALEEVNRKLPSISEQKTLVHHLDENAIVDGDRHMLHLLISNLLDNALKYSPENSMVVIEVYRAQDTLVLCVKDNGPGITQNERKNIFKKFFRGGSEGVRRQKGTGLGLYLVSQITKLHSAELTLLDNLPQGSIFEVRFQVPDTKP